jgi:hypothetical protein
MARRLVGNTLLAATLFTAAGATSACEAGAPAVSIEALTESQIAAGAHLVASQCLNSEANGNTTVSGEAAGTRTKLRNFLVGNISCRVVTQQGSLTEVAVTDSAATINGNPTRVEFTRSIVQYKGSDAATSWAFSQAVRNATNGSTVIAEGYALSSGSTDSEVSSCVTPSISAEPRSCDAASISLNGEKAQTSLGFPLLMQAESTALGAMSIAGGAK